MYPDRITAEQIVEDSYRMTPEPWRDHSYVVARCAEQIASSCGMNKNKAYVFGLLHDIGRRVKGANFAHVIRGYEYLTALGYDEAARICMTHSFQTQKMSDYFGPHDVTPDEEAKIASYISHCVYDDYDRLIQLCDSISLATVPTDLVTRITDIKKRYGMYPQDKWEKNFELK